jgi:hypothetical protein
MGDPGNRVDKGGCLIVILELEVFPDRFFQKFPSFKLPHQYRDFASREWWHNTFARSALLMGKVTYVAHFYSSWLLE